MGLHVDSIEFPTYGVTWRQIRAMSGVPSTVDDLAEFCGDLDIVEVHYLELRLAESAYNRAIGDGLVIAPTERASIMDVLHKAYQRYGIVNSVEETREALIRVELQAAKQSAASRVR